mgnify:CR=1 FL=1
MDFYELKNKYFSLVRKKMINDYKMGNIDFMESEELLDHIIERIGMYQDHGKSDDESIASAFRDFHGIASAYFRVHCWSILRWAVNDPGSRICVSISRAGWHRVCG